MALLVLGLGTGADDHRAWIDFQLAYAYDAFLAERAAWRAVIHLNLIRSVNNIIEILWKELSATSSPTGVPARPYTPMTELHGALDADSDDESEEPEPEPSADSSPSPLTEFHRELMLRLSPLRQVQRDLERSLGAASSEELPTHSGGAAPWSLGGGGWRSREFSVTSRSGWKGALGRIREVGRKSIDSTMGRYDRRGSEVSSPSPEGRVSSPPKVSWNNSPGNAPGADGDAGRRPANLRRGESLAA